MAQQLHVTPDKVVSATVSYSNKNTPGREWDIAGDVEISGNSVKGINAGYIRKETTDTTMSIPSGNFNVGTNGSYLSMTFGNAGLEEQIEMLREVWKFMEGVTESVKENKLNVIE